MDLDRYLERIGYEGRRDPTLDVLRSVHRCHATTIAYENIDVYLQRRVSIDVAAAFEKLVVRGRGGWCYENNGLLGWALTELGFNVTRVAGAVMRSEFAESPLGGHLMIRVDVEGSDAPLIADVGLGGALVEPIPLIAGDYTQGWRTFHLDRLDDAHWRFHNTDGGQPRDVDFTVSAVDDATLVTNCDRLQDSETSTFRQNLVAGSISDAGGYRLTGRRVTDMRSGEQHLVATESELIDVLGSTFAITLPSDLDGLWDRVEARHHELFGPDAMA